MRDKVVWIGVIIVALGIVLPWTTYSVSLGGNRVDGTTPGYEYLQSFIALAIAVAGALLGIKLSKQTKRLTLIASGAIVVIVAGAALADLSGPDQVSTEPQLNSYLFLRKARIGATTTAFGGKMYKNNFAQVLNSATVGTTPTTSKRPREIREAQRRFHQPNMTARVSSDPHIGVFVTILGGLLVGIGGFTSTMREAE